MKKYLKFFAAIALCVPLQLHAAGRPIPILEGGATADTDVSISSLSLSSPSYEEVIDFKVTLPSSYTTKTTKEKGKFAELLAHEVFVGLEVKNSRGSKFTLVACNGTYELEEDNGYDGFYVILDEDKKVARFSEAGEIVKASFPGIPLILINESKAYKDGRVRFGKGIRLEEGYAPQMSEAWIRIVAHNILKKREIEGKCPITDHPSKNPSRRFSACSAVHKAILDNLVEGDVKGVRSVFRIATVLDDHGNWKVHSLFNEGDESMEAKTTSLIEMLFG